MKSSLNWLKKIVLQSKSRRFKFWSSVP